MSNPIHGACLCGQVQYQVSGPFDAFHLCHCSQCRRSTGTAHAANIFTSADRLQWLAGEELIKRYTPDEPDVISKCFLLALRFAGALHQPQEWPPDHSGRVAERAA